MGETRTESPAMRHRINVMRLRIRPIGMLAGALLLNAALAEETLSVYKWRDEKGKIVYQDRPPPVQASRVEEKQLRLQQNVVESSPTESSSSTSTAGQQAPTTDQSSLSRKVAAGAVAEVGAPQPPNPLAPGVPPAPVAPPSIPAPPLPAAPPAPPLPPGSNGSF